MTLNFIVGILQGQPPVFAIVGAGSATGQAQGPAPTAPTVLFAAASKKQIVDGLHFSFTDQAGEMLITAIKGFFCVVGKYAGRQLALFNVILKTITA